MGNPPMEPGSSYALLISNRTPLSFDSCTRISQRSCRSSGERDLQLSISLH